MIEPAASGRGSQSNLNGYDMANCPKVVAATIIVLALVVVLVTESAFSADGRGHGDKSFVPSTNSECAGAADCLSTTFPAVTVQARNRQSTRAVCPASHPNLWGWDVANDEQIQIDLVASDTGAVTVEGINKTATPGDFAVSLGCTAGAVTATQLLKSRVLGRTQSRSVQQRQPRVIGGPASIQADDPCTWGNSGNPVPNCQAQPQEAFFLWGWHDGRRYFDCKAPYPYVWNYTYTEADGDGVTSLGFQFEESPQSFDIWFTNWSIYQTGSIVVTLACSKTNS